MNSRMLRSVLIFLLGFGLMGAFASDSNAQEISELPYFENFSEGEFPGGWETIGTVEISSWSDRIEGYSIRYSSPTADPMAITPEIHSDYTITDMTLRFDAHYATSGDDGDKVHVGFISDPADAATFTLIETYTLGRDATNFTVDLSGHQAGDGRRIALKAERGGAWNSHYYGNILLQDVNDPVNIGPFALLTPAAGLDLLVEGNAEEEVVITWEQAELNLDEDLNYTWHLDTRGGDFADPIVSLPADSNGNASQITLTFEQIDGLLEENGLDVGQILEADWTVTGEFYDYVEFAEETFDINLERGNLHFEYATINDLLVNAEIGEQAVLSNEVIVTFVSPSFRNQHYLSDETGAVLVDDNNNILSGLGRGDGITGFSFEFSEYQGTTQLVPMEDIDASSSDNELPYWETTLADLEYVGEPRLMKVEVAEFLDEGDFEASTNYDIVDPTVEDPVTFRTHLGDSDVIGQPIPDGTVNLMGIAAEFNDVPQLYAAHYDLFESVADPFTVYYNNPEDWEEVYAYAWEDDGDPYVDWPGELMNEPEEGSDWYSYHLPSNFDMIIFNNGDDQQTDDLARNETGWYDGEVWHDEEPVDEVELPFEVMFQFSTIDGTLPDWFGAHTERGMIAHDGEMYVVSRADGANIYVLDNQTGELIDTLDNEGISGGTFLLNDIEASGDGHLFAGNLTVDASSSAFKLYRVGDGEPSVVLEYTDDNGARLGDKLTIVGNWNDGGMTLFAPDGNSASVLKFEMNGEESLFGNPEIISLDEVDAGSTPVVAPLPDGRFFWTASGRDVHLFESDGAHIGVLPSDLLSGATTALRYLGTVNGDHLLAGYIHGHVSPEGENENIHLVRVPEDDLDQAELVFHTTSMRGADNPNGTGEVSFVGYGDGSVDLFVLGTNNGIGGYYAFDLEVEFPDYSTDLELISIADARDLDDGRLVMIEGLVNSTDFGFSVADYFVQDESAGMNITDFDQGGSQMGPYVEPGDEIAITGELDTFRGQRNIQVRGFEILSSDNDLPEPIVIEGADMAADSEYQGMRVQLRDMYIIDEDIDAWPEDGADEGSGVNIRITSEAEADTFIVRLARNNTAFGEGAGQPLPEMPFHVTGTMGQYYDDTQLFPFFEDDFEAAEERFAVTLEVYMGGAAEFDPDDHDVFVTGSMAGWAEPGSNPDFKLEPMDDDADTYTLTLHLTAGEYEYKYFLVEDDPTWDMGEWDGDPNRELEVTEDMVVEDVFGSVTSTDPMADLPTEFGLDQNYPNPFNPTTNIRYQLPESANVTIQVYDVTGQLITTLVNENREAGEHEVTFDATRLASGIYLYRMHAGDFVQTKKLMLVK